jgi:hypothetical protein
MESKDGTERKQANYGQNNLCFFLVQNHNCKKDLMCIEDAWKWKSEGHERKDGVGEISSGQPPMS